MNSFDAIEFLVQAGGQEPSTRHFRVSPRMASAVGRHPNSAAASAARGGMLTIWRGLNALGAVRSFVLDGAVSDRPSVRRPGVGSAIWQPFGRDRVSTSVRMLRCKHSWSCNVVRCREKGCLYTRGFYRTACRRVRMCYMKPFKICGPLTTTAGAPTTLHSRW